MAVHKKKQMGNKKSWETKISKKLNTKQFFWCLKVELLHLFCDLKHISPFNQKASSKKRSLNYIKKTWVI